jgi:uncharacterized protein YggE
MRVAPTLALFAALTLAPNAASAALPVAPPTAAEATLNVQGDGVVERAPDVARLFVQIVTNDDSATISTSKNNDIYNKLQAALAPLGVSGDALGTSGYNVVFIPHPPAGLPPAQQQPRYGYVTTRALSMTIANLANVGKVIDAATSAGVTSVGSVSFDLKDRKSAYRAALGVAMQDARASAQAVATGGGVTLARIRSITVGYQYVPLVQAGMMRAAAAPATPTDVQPGGPISVSAHVDVTFAIK